ncbi:DUF2384 domain-containing protein [Burkholderia ambifaria]|uniref:type II RES/Xre toxin-antitoxin system antitoxin n=1 Tax=Burkholderia ambifaria TaxID=152480 RepID=UPI001E50B9DD|nr:antitoxin Xre/MbcA/ParS toxin-binding domain-containing protein [Burkholderia ambifaria]UEP38971.1 DUF2384 domain-containing protein [Burkholderia ambifaria]
MAASSSTSRAPIGHPPRGRVAKHAATPARFGANQGDFAAFLHMAPMSQRRTIADGFDATIVERVARDLLGVSVQSLLTSLSLPSSTILRKIAKEDRLSQSESDRLARVLYVHQLATEVFEDDTRAAEWMNRGNVELDGHKPIEVLDVQPGYDRVRDILNRAQFGVAA